MRIHQKRRCLIILIPVFLGIIFGNLIIRLENPFYSAVEAHSVSSVNKAIEEALESIDINYGDFIKLSVSDNGKVSSMTADGIAISKLKSTLVRKIEKSIEHSAVEKISVPIFAFQKNPVLVGIGPYMHFKIKPAALVSADFRDKFSSVGINQTRHTIYLDTVVKVTITSAGNKKTEKIHNSILAADTVIVGDVPDFYASGGMLSDYAKGKRNDD